MAYERKFKKSMVLTDDLHKKIKYLSGVKYSFPMWKVIEQFVNKEYENYQRKVTGTEN